MKIRNVFAGPYVDRAAHLRQDAAWFASALADAESRVVPVWNSRSLIAPGETPRAAFPTLGEIAERRPDPDALVLLGRVDRTNFFAYEIEGVDPPQLAGGARFEDLRLVASLLPPDEAGLLGYARAMISWRRRHRFCGSCGTKTVPARGGDVLVCTNAPCRPEQFPRLDPPIIALSSHRRRPVAGRRG